MPFGAVVVLVVAAVAMGLIAGWLSADRDLPCPACERRKAETRAKLKAGGWTPAKE